MKFESIGQKVVNEFSNPQAHEELLRAINDFCYLADEYNLDVEKAGAYRATSAYWQTNPDIMDVTNTYGTFTASFNTSVNGGGAMYQYYGSKAVPAGWLVPLTYINIGRQVSEDEEIAKVRLIVPHSQGHSDASSNVYPCFYEITYQEMRN